MLKKTIFFMMTLFPLFSLKSQPTENQHLTISVFIDCEFCDLNFIKTELTQINYSREAKEADVHILITSMNTGSGGEQITLLFFGQKEFKNNNDTIVFNNLSDDTDDIKRTRILQNIKIGLFGYFRSSGLKDFVNVEIEIPEKKAQVEDTWKKWVFSISSSGYINKDNNFSQYNIYNYLTANKITEKFKTESSFNHNYSESNYNTIDYNYKSLNRSYSMYHQDVFSLTSHWSAGISAGASSSTFSNIKFKYYILPAIEYNIFPYSKATHKQVRINYTIGGVNNSYFAETIYNKTKEILWRHNLDVATEFNQKWGRIWLYASYSNFLQNFSLMRLSFNTSISLRLLKGLEFYVSAGYTVMHDQLSLSKGDATQEELLLQQRELKTEYSVWSNAGLTFTFGNLYNNVVNPRFGN